MNFRALLIAVLVMASGASAALAAEGQSLGFGAGLSAPIGDWSDVAGTGFEFGGSYCYNASSQFGIGADLGYHMLGEKSATVTDGVNFLTVKLKTSALQAGVHARFYVPVNGSKTEPYFRVGFGLYNLSQKGTVEVTDGQSTVSGSGSTSESKVGFNMGIGLMIGVSDKAGIGIEALYHLVPMSNDTELAAATNSSGDAAPLNVFSVGVSYNFLMPR